MLKRNFADQFNKLTEDQRVFIKALVSEAPSGDVKQVEAANLRIRLSQEGKDLTLQEVEDLMSSLKCIH